MNRTTTNWNLRMICVGCLNARRIWVSTPQIADYADDTD